MCMGGGEWRPNVPQQATAGLIVDYVRVAVAIARRDRDERVVVARARADAVDVKVGRVGLVGVRGLVG